MKTGVVLMSKDRELFGVTIRQDTKSQFLSVTDLQESYTRARIERGWSSKNVNEILTGKENVERVYFVLKESGAIEIEFSTFMEMVHSDSLVKVLKRLGVYRTSGRGSNRSTYCNPYIWILLAMELNPELYGKVVVWMTDNLIINRIEAGDKYNELCRAAARFPDVDYRSIAKGINFIVFNVHETMIRNKASQDELKEIEFTQYSLAVMIDMGFITSFSQLLGVMRDMYQKKWGK